jgi:hypothetical protein
LLHICINFQWNYGSGQIRIQSFFSALKAVKFLGKTWTIFYSFEKTFPLNGVLPNPLHVFFKKTAISAFSNSLIRIRDPNNPLNEDVVRIRIRNIPLNYSRQPTAGLKPNP